jgi:glycosyltransferase involved in cell wall biosynthesis
MTDAGWSGDDDPSTNVSSRVLRRWRRNGVRALHGLRRLGPGRLAGVVIVAESDGLSISAKGWAATPTVPVHAVVVTIDGRPAGAATVGLPTPEMPDGPVTRWSATAGWEVRIERPEGLEGTVSVGALVVRDDGLVDEAIPRTLTLPPFPVTNIDTPAEGEDIVPPFALVSGWAVDETIDRIEVRIGDSVPQRVRMLAEPQPDLAERMDDARQAPLGGWWIIADVPPDLDGPTVLRVDAIAGDRTFCVGERTVTITPNTGSPLDDPTRVRQLAARADALAARHQAIADRPSLLVGTHDLGLGGGQLYLHELLRRILEPGDVDCTVLSNLDGVLRDELEEWGAQVHVVGPVPRTGTDYEQRMSELALLANLTSANVGLANTAGCFWMVDLATRLGLPSLWALHESFSLERFVVEGLGGVDDHVLSRFGDAFAAASAVVFEADATAELFRDVIPAGRSRRIDYGIHLERIDAFRAAHDRTAARRAKGYTDDDVVLLCLGTFEPRKAQGLLCAAFARVADRHPRARLALVGDLGTPYSEAVHFIVHRHELTDRVALTGLTPDIDSWYHIADGFVLASDVESLPRSMLEVMAFEVPVVGAAVFGIPELITDGLDGMLFEPRCMASLTSALDRFFSLAPDERRALGHRARERVVPSRDSRGYAEEYRSLIDGLLAGRG